MGRESGREGGSEEQREGASQISDLGFSHVMHK